MSDGTTLVLAGSIPWAAILAGLAFGTVHACNADHVMTITSISRSGSHSRRAVLGYGMRWSLGHALSLIVIGTLLTAGGWSFPWLLGAAAESLVAITLCALGLYLLGDALRRPVEPMFHCAYRARSERIPARGIVCLGSLHGLAGTAPVLALMPLAQRLDLWFTCAYLVCFSLGVILAMFVIAGLLSSADTQARRYGRGLEKILNAVIGCGTFAVGVSTFIAVIQ